MPTVSTNGNNMATAQCNGIGQRKLEQCRGAEDNTKGGRSNFSLWGQCRELAILNWEFWRIATRDEGRKEKGQFTRWTSILAPLFPIHFPSIILQLPSNIFPCFPFPYNCLLPPPFPSKIFSYFTHKSGRRRLPIPDHIFLSFMNDWPPMLKAIILFILEYFSGQMAGISSYSYLYIWVGFWGLITQVWGLKIKVFLLILVSSLGQ